MLKCVRIAKVNPIFPAPGKIQFEKRSFKVKKDIGTAKITVVRVGGADGAVTINWSTQPDSAIDGTHYTGKQNQPLTFDAGQSEKDIDIPILDKEETDDKVFRVELSAASPDLLGDPIITEVIITNKSESSYFTTENSINRKQ